MKDRFYVSIAYDVTDDKRRRKLAELLLRYGERVQFSVYDLLVSERRLIEVQQRVLEVIDADTDSVRYYRLCTRCERTITIQGAGTVREDEPIIIV